MSSIRACKKMMEEKLNDVFVDEFFKNLFYLFFVTSRIIPKANIFLAKNCRNVCEKYMPGWRDTTIRIYDKDQELQKSQGCLGPLIMESSEDYYRLLVKHHAGIKKNIFESKKLTKDLIRTNHSATIGSEKLTEDVVFLIFDELLLTNDTKDQAIKDFAYFVKLAPFSIIFYLHCLKSLIDVTTNSFVDRMNLANQEKLSKLDKLNNNFYKLVDHIQHIATDVVNGVSQIFYQLFYPEKQSSLYQLGLATLSTLPVDVLKIIFSYTAPNFQERESAFQLKVKEQNEVVPKQN